MTTSADPEILRVRLTLDVAYTPNGVTPDALKSRLYDACAHAIGEGLLTGSTEAEVDAYDIRVAELTPAEAAASKV